MTRLTYEGESTPLGQQTERPIVQKNIKDLLAHNPAGIIVEPGIVQDIVDNFSLDQFDPIQTVAVKLRDHEHDLILDGFHRLAGLDAHGEKFAPTIDVTQAILKDPGRSSLTMTEYLRRATKYTKAHQEIADLRTAALLIQGWEGMVGEETAQRYSAAAALGFLARPEVARQRDSEALRYYLTQRQKEFFADETPKDRAKITKALVETYNIMRATRVSNKKAAEAAYQILVGHSVALVKEGEVERQAFGLLYSNEVEDKLASYNIGQREQMRVDLGNALVSSWGRSAEGGKPPETTFTLTTGILKDPRIPYQETIKVLTADSPQEAYDSLIIDINTRTFIQNYRRFKHAKLLEKRVPRNQAYDESEKLTQFEKFCLTKLSASVNYPPHGTAQEMFRLIRQGVSLYSASAEYLDYLSQNEKDLLASGLTTKDIKEADSDIRREHGRFERFTTLEQFISAQQSLQKTFNQVRETVQNKLNFFSVAQITDEVLGEGFDQKLAEAIRKSILQQATPDESGRIAVNQITNLAGRFKNLDPDLVIAVVAGNHSWSRAEQIQEIRRTKRAKEPKSVRQEQPELDQEIRSGRVAVPPAQSPPEKTINIPRSSEERRQRLINSENESLIAALEELDLILRVTNLNREDLKPAAVIKAREVFRGLAKLLFRIENPEAIISRYDPEKIRALNNLLTQFHKRDTDLTDSSRTGR